MHGISRGVSDGVGGLAIRLPSLLPNNLCSLGFGGIVSTRFA